MLSEGREAIDRGESTTHTGRGARNPPPTGVPGGERRKVNGRDGEGKGREGEGWQGKGS